MKLNTFEITKINESLLETEILFYIASTRATGGEVIKLAITGDNAQRTLSSALKILRSAKKRKSVQLFLTAEDLYTGTTEGEYMKNKYPEVQDVCIEGELAILIKV